MSHARICIPSGINILTLFQFSRLWVYGGMLINPLGDPVQDVFVLTMPSFMFVPKKQNSREFPVAI